MTSSTYTLNDWLSDLGKSTFSFRDAVFAFENKVVKGNKVDPAYWPVLYQRFPEEQWQHQVAQWVITDFLGSTFSVDLLEQQLQRLVAYLPALRTIISDIQITETLANDANIYSDVLITAVDLLRTGHSASPRASYFRVTLSRDIPTIDVVAECLSALEEDPWSDLPYPRDALAHLFNVASTDPRTAPGTAGELLLALAAFRTSKTASLGEALANRDSHPWGEPYGEIDNLRSSHNNNRFWRAYLLALYDYEVHRELDVPAVNLLVDTARAMHGKMPLSEYLLWMRITAKLEGAPSQLLQTWGRCAGADVTGGYRVPLSEAWKSLRKDLADQFPIWDALGLEGDDWISACETFDHQHSGSLEVSQFPLPGSLM